MTRGHLGLDASPHVISSLCHAISKKRVCFPSRVSCVSSGESNLNVGALGDRTLDVCSGTRARYQGLRVLRSAVLVLPSVVYWERPKSSKLGVLGQEEGRSSVEAFEPVASLSKSS